MQTKSLRRKGILAAIGLLLSLLAGIVAAVLTPSLAARAGSSARFCQRHSNAFASVAPLTVKDPFTGRTLFMEAGLPFLFVESNDRNVYAYCIQKGMQIFDCDDRTRRGYALDDSMFGALSAQAKEQLILVMLYGYPNRTAAELNTTDAAAHAATQILLWECALSYRDTAFGRMDDRVYNAYFSGGRHADVRAAYEHIAQGVTEYLRTPSFFTDGQCLRLDLALDPVTGLYIQRFADTNQSNADLAVSGKNPAGLTISREGNSYIFQAAAKPAAEVAVSIRRTDIPSCREGYGPPLIWVDPNAGAENQLLFSGCEARAQCFVVCLPGCPEATSTTAPATETTTAPATQTTSTTATTTGTITETTTKTATICTTESTTSAAPPTTEPATQPTTQPTTQPQTQTTCSTSTTESSTAIQSTQAPPPSTIPGSSAATVTSSAASTESGTISGTAARTSTRQSTTGRASGTTGRTMTITTRLDTTTEEVPQTSTVSTDAAVVTMAFSGLLLLALGAGAVLRRRRGE